MKRMRRIVMTVARVVLLAVAGFLALLYACQPGMVYLPEKEIHSTPAAIGFRYEEVFFKAEDGVNLHGWFVPSEPARGILLFCHGNAGNISDRLHSIEIFHRLGLSVFIFDYRGYGRSEGKPTEEGTYRDAEGAWRYLLQERRSPPQKVILFGRSLGGAVAAWLAQDRDAGALILESTFTSFRDIAGDIYPWLPTRLLARFGYETAACLARVRCPVLVIHSVQDELIPSKHGEKLFAAAKEPKMFLEISGGHNDGFIRSGTRYEEGLNTFLVRYLGRPQNKRP
jgi:alpha-beta hydrolase superfamily lysophospholipase